MNWDSVPLRDVLHLSKVFVPTDDQRIYPYAAFRPYPAGLSPKGQRKGSDFRNKQLQMVSAGQFVISKTRIQQRHWAIAQPEVQGSIVSRGTACFDIDPQLNLQYFAAYLSTTAFHKATVSAVTKQGRLDLRRFTRIAIPFPPSRDQVQIAEVWQQTDKALMHTIDMFHSITELKKGVAADLFRRAGSSAEQQRLGSCTEIGRDTSVQYAIYLGANGKLLPKHAPPHLLDEAIGITPGAEIDARYLQYFLEQQQTQWQQSNGNVPLQLETALRMLNIPLSTLYEQRKLVAVLQEHDDVLNKLKTEHHELRQLTDGMIQQIFSGNLSAFDSMTLLGTL